MRSHTTAAGGRWRATRRLAASCADGAMHMMRSMCETRTPHLKLVGVCIAQGCVKPDPSQSGTCPLIPGAHARKHGPAPQRWRMHACSHYAMACWLRAARLHSPQAGRRSHLMAVPWSLAGGCARLPQPLPSSPARSPQPLPPAPSSQLPGPARPLWPCRRRIHVLPGQLQRAHVWPLLPRPHLPSHGEHQVVGDGGLAPHQQLLR